MGAIIAPHFDLNQAKAKKPPHASRVRGLIQPNEIGLAVLNIRVGANIFTQIQLAWTANF